MLLCEEGTLYHTCGHHCQAQLPRNPGGQQELPAALEPTLLYPEQPRPEALSPNTAGTGDAQKGEPLHRKWVILKARVEQMYKHELGGLVQ